MLPRSGSRRSVSCPPACELTTSHAREAGELKPPGEVGRRKEFESQLVQVDAFRAISLGELAKQGRLPRPGRAALQPSRPKEMKLSFGTPRKIAGTQIAALPLLFAVALFGSLAHLACDSAAPDDDATQGDAAPGDGGGPDAAPSDGGGPDAAATDQLTPTYAPTYFVSPSGNDGNDGLTAAAAWATIDNCLLYTSPSPRDRTRSRMPSSA